MSPRVDAARHQIGGLAEAADALLGADTLLAATHERSDGDALSAIALAHAWRRLGRTSAVLHDFPPSYEWILGQGRGDWTTVERVDDTAFIVTCDTAHYARIAWPAPIRQQVDEVVRAAGGEAQVALGLYDAIVPVHLVIDHHATNRGYGLLNWIEPERSAVAEMVADLLRHVEERTGERLVDDFAACCLFVGLVTSTHWFQLDTGPHTWETAQYLDRVGHLDKAAVADHLNHMRLNHYRLSGVLRQQVAVDGGVAHAYIDREMLARTGVSSVDAAGFVDDMDQIDAAIVLLFVEMETGGVRVRLRSRTFPMHTLAQEFGGGGHERASGTVLKAADEARQLVSRAQAMVREAGRA